MAHVARKTPPKSTTTVPWDEVAKTLGETPNQAVLFDEFKDTIRVRSLLTMVNGGKVPALNALPGKVRAFMRNSYMDHAGRRRGELWLCLTIE